MNLNNRDIFIKNIFTLTAPYIDLLSSLLSFGLSVFWRRKLVALSRMKEGGRILDVCTGTGKTALLIRKKMGHNGMVIGVDFCEDMIRIGEKKNNSARNNISFMLADAKKMPFPDSSFDTVITAFGIRNVQDSVSALKEINRILKPGASFYCLELFRPEKQWFVSLYRFYLFKIMPAVGTFIVRSALPYNYLPGSIFNFPLPDEFRRTIESCGFRVTDILSMTGGAAVIYGTIKHG